MFRALLLPGLWLVSSCSPPAEKTEEKGEVVAQVYNYKLYRSDLADMVPEGQSKEDSARVVDNYINSWVHEMVLFHKAEENLTAQQKNVTKQLEDYRHSLIVYAYEKELVRQKLDTTVGEEEISRYYEEHQQDFELKDNILKVVYVKVDKKAPQIAKLRTLYKSDKPADQQELTKYCKQFAQNYYLEENTWLLFDDLLKEIPIQTYNKELFLQNNRFVEVADSASMYFVNIKGFKIRNSLSPLAFERENIRNIILNRRKQELIEKMKKDLLSEAQNNGKIMIKSK